MSPRTSEPLYGLIKLKCPRKHELGAIMVQPRKPMPGQTQRLRRLDGVIKPPKITRGSDGEFELPEPETLSGGGSVPPGLPIRATCRECREQRWPKYCYEECWELIEPEIRRLAETPVVTITLR